MQLTQRSSFHPTAPDSHAIQHNLVEQQCQRIILERQSLQLSSQDQLSSLPHFNRLVASYHRSLTLSINSLYQELKLSSEETEGYRMEQHNIKYQLFKMILTALQKKLFSSKINQKFYQEVSYSLSLKANLLPFFLSILSQNTNCIPLERLNSFQRNLTSEQFPLYLPIQLYFLFGGSLFTIESKRFKQKIVQLIDHLARALSHSDTFIGRNVEFYKNNKERKLILDESIKVVLLAKNKENLQQTASNITQYIFNSKEYLSKQQFLHILQSKPLDPTLTIFPLLLRTQFILMQQKSFQSHLLTRSEVAKTNFYSHQMTKLFNKCPFNGDERCNCKKCQCVRRNRESAKLNQQKKRNAVEQVEHMKKRIEQLQRREELQQRKIGQLQEQNLMLKSLIKQIKMDPSMKSSLLQTIEPVSKILNNQL